MKGFRYLLVAALIGCAFSWIYDVNAEGITVRVLDSVPKTPLVQHGQSWHYFKGNRSVTPADWKTAPDDQLLLVPNPLPDVLPSEPWPLGPGGFGFGDGDDATELTDMSGNYSTLYFRR